MTDEDGFRIEAAEQFGFTPTDPDAERYECTEAQLIAFSKACERKGLCEAHGLTNRDAVHRRILDIDAELAPVLEAERRRARKERERQLWNDEIARRNKEDRDCEVCGGDCAAANPPVMNCPLEAPCGGKVGSDV